MKKILTGVLAGAIFFAAAAFPAWAKGENDEAFRTRVVQSFSLTGMENDPDTMVTRGDWAILLYEIMNYRYDPDEPAAGRKIFNDVDKYHYLSGYLEYLYGKSVISGDDKRDFRPAENITGADLYNTLMRMAGYGRYMDSLNGGYQNNIAKAADMAGLKTKYLNASEITYRQLTDLLYDALYLKCMNIDEFKENSVSIENGSELISSVMDLEYRDGILTQAGECSLNELIGEKLQITVDGVRYEYVDPEMLSDSVGMRVRVFSDDSDAVAVVPYEQESVDLYYDDIDSFENNVYTAGDKTTKRYRLDTGFSILYNGRLPQNSPSMIPEYGYVTLLDNDDDGTYDVVMIHDQDVLYSTGTSEQNDQIYAKNHQKQAVSYDLASYQSYLLLDAQGQKIGIGDLAENMLLIKEESDNKAFLKIQILDDLQTGTVRSYSSDGLTIDETEYEQGTKLYAENNYGVGQTVSFLLDGFGRIIYIKAEPSEDWQFGYLISAKLSDEGEEEIILKLLEQNGEIARLTCAEKLTVDGTVYRKSAEAAFVQINEENVIRYKVKDEKVVSIDQPRDVELSNTTAAVTDKDSLLRRVDGGTFLSSSDMSIFKYSGNTGLAGDCARKPGGVIFGIDSTAEGDDQYRVVNLSNIYVDRGFGISGFNCDPESFLMDVILIKSYTGAETHHAPIFMVEKMTTTYNESKDEVYYNLQGLYGGAEGSISVSSQGAAAQRVEKLEKGDIIYITKKDRDGNVLDFTLIYSPNPDKATAIGENTYEWDDAECRFLFAKPAKVDGNYLMISAFNQLHCNEIFNCSGVPVYIYESKNNQMRYGSLNEILAQDKIVVQTQKSVPKMIAVYR